MKNKHPDLISFIIPSRNLENLSGFFDCLEAKTRDLSRVEVLVKLDDDHVGAKEFIEHATQTRPFQIRYELSPRLEGIFSLWVSMNQLFFDSSPDTYFVQLISDEVRIDTLHWDDVLDRYRGYYADHVFRLRTSTQKFCNYYTQYQCAYMPDSFPIYTRIWLELTEGAGDCWGSDAFQQGVAYQMGLGEQSYATLSHRNALYRDVTLESIVFSGLEFGKGVSAEEAHYRTRWMYYEWNRLATYTQQVYYAYLARKILAYVWAVNAGIPEFKIESHASKQLVYVVDCQSGDVPYAVSYAVPFIPVFLQNMKRRMMLFVRLMLFKLFRRGVPVLRMMKRIWDALLDLWNRMVRLILSQWRLSFVALRKRERISKSTQETIRQKSRNLLTQFHPLRNFSFWIVKHNPFAYSEPPSLYRLRKKRFIERCLGKLLWINRVPRRLALSPSQRAMGEQAWRTMQDKQTSLKSKVYRRIGDKKREDNPDNGLW